MSSTIVQFLGRIGENFVTLAKDGKLGDRKMDKDVIR